MSLFIWAHFSATFQSLTTFGLLQVNSTFTTFGSAIALHNHCKYLPLDYASYPLRASTIHYSQWIKRDSAMRATKNNQRNYIWKMLKVLYWNFRKKKCQNRQKSENARTSYGIMRVYIIKFELSFSFSPVLNCINAVNLPL